MALHVRRRRPFQRPARRRRNGGIVRQLRVMQIGIGDIEAKAVHAALQPAIQHLQAPLRARPRSPSSAWAAGAGICGGNIAAAPADRPRPGRRTPTANCWARCRRPWDRPRHTSRAFASRSPSRLAANQACSSEVCASTSSRMIFRPRACAASTSAWKSARCRNRDARRHNPKRHSPSRGWAKDGSAKARSHPRPETRCNPAWRSGRRNRPARRHCRRRNCGHRPDR